MNIVILMKCRPKL